MNHCIRALCVGGPFHGEFQSVNSGARDLRLAYLPEAFVGCDFRIERESPQPLIAETHTYTLKRVAISRLGLTAAGMVLVHRDAVDRNWERQALGLMFAAILC